MKKYIYLQWEHTSWGDSIEITNWERGEIHGWLQRIPEKGDKIIWKLKSGKMGETEVTQVELCGNPIDMFFANLKEVGYISQKDLDKKSKNQKSIFKSIFSY